jgi:D-alanine-D-alanine ligase
VGGVIPELQGRPVAVLAGGPSCEREISLISGKAVLDALQSKGVDAFHLDPSGDFIDTLLKKNAAIAFLALHGTFGEDGTIQRLLEDAGIPYTGSGPAASEKGFDKAVAQNIFKDAKIRVPGLRLVRVDEARPSARSVSFPCVVKPAKAGSSVGVSILQTPDNFEAALDEAFKYSDTVLIEDFIAGRELTVGILGDRPLPVVEITAQRKFYDYDAKYKDTGTRYEVPAQLTPEQAKKVQDVALAAYEALGCEIMGRVDVILDAQDRPYVLEINTIPGLTGKSLLPKAARAAGIEFPELCVKIISLSLERVKAW